MKETFCRRCGWPAHGPICLVCLGTFVAGCVTTIVIGVVIGLVRLVWR